jgi:hypothetical protein
MVMDMLYGTADTYMEAVNEGLVIEKDGLCLTGEPYRFLSREEYNLKFKK